MMKKNFSNICQNQESGQGRNIPSLLDNNYNIYVKNSSFERAIKYRS